MEDELLDEEGKGAGRPKGSKNNLMRGAELQSFTIDATRKIMGEHMCQRDFVRFCKESYGLSRATALQYWQKIWNNARKKFELEKDKLIIRHLDRYWSLYNEALAKGDLNNARQVLNDIAKLQGLNEPNKIEVNGPSIKLKFGDEPEQNGKDNND